MNSILREYNVPKGPWFFTALDNDIVSEVLTDPLGLTPIWSFFGHQLVPNLTGRSGNIRQFLISLIGLHFLNRVTGNSDSRNADFWPFILGFEQLIAHLQARKNPGDFSGIVGKRKAIRFSEEESIRIGSKPSCQVIANQRYLGTYAMVRTPLKNMVIIDSNDNILEPDSTLKLIFGNRYDEVRRIEDKIAKSFEVLSSNMNEADIGELLTGRTLTSIYSSFANVLLLDSLNSSMPDTYYRFFKEALKKVHDSHGNCVLHNGATATVEAVILKNEDTVEEIVLHLSKHNDMEITLSAKKIAALEAILCRIEPFFEVISHSDSHTNLRKIFSNADINIIAVCAKRFGETLDTELMKRFEWLVNIKDVGTVKDMSTALIQRHKDDLQRRGRNPWVRFMADNGDFSTDLHKWSLETALKYSKGKYGEWRRGYFISQMQNILFFGKEETANE